MNSRQELGNNRNRAKPTAPLVRRFWLPRGVSPDTSDRGFLTDPERILRFNPHASMSARFGFELERMTKCPVLALLGEPGMGKSTEIRREAQRLAEVGQTGDLLLSVDLASCASDIRVCQEIFQSASFTAWKSGSTQLHILLDGVDTCLLHVPTLVSLLLQRFEHESTDRLSLRIACRATEWPNDLEEGLRTLWGEDGVAVIQLVPLRREDAKSWPIPRVSMVKSSLGRWTESARLSLLIDRLPSNRC